MDALHALITGGSSGIGLELGKKLAAAGYDISLIARRESLLKTAADEIARNFRRPGQRVVIHAADVSNAAQAEAAVQDAIGELGAPELVVTSAGIAIPGYFEEVPLEVHERTMAIDYFGTLYVVRAALPTMRKRRRGRVVMISSGAALMGLFGYSPYSPPKFALRGLAEGLRQELKPDNVAVSIVYPPDTETPMLEEENKTKPAETKLITSVAKMWGAEGVASCIMRGIAAGKFSITPGFMITIMQKMPGVMVPLLHWYCDRLIAGVQKQRGRGAGVAGGRREPVLER